ncbi:cell division protein [Bifidobacterium sp. DSM 109957]|uniref:Cell division protein n=2 Tax=Bifidobacterium oedipodis TaxID=2675322 RepID=A0A7Y0HTJ6_9BIFI|nr:cell division protein [Bifidobacterium sp. DSM 109957]
MSDDQLTGYTDTSQMDGTAQNLAVPPAPTGSIANANAGVSAAANATALGSAPQPPAEPSPTEAAPAEPAPTEAANPVTAAKPRATAAIDMDALPDLRETLNPESAEDKSRAEFTTVYDIIDQLEESLNEAKSALFSPSQVKVDREEFTEQLTELKKMLPVQLERASALMREAERRLESAQTQANAIVASAQSRAADMVREANEQAQFLAGQENVTELARHKARQILESAQAKSDHLTQGADQYCTTVMQGLQQQLGKLSQDVQAGLNVLEERQRAAGEQLPNLNLNDYPEAQ